MATEVNSYQDFLRAKQQLAGGCGFKPLWMPSFLKDFQKYLVDWQIRMGTGAIYADCGLGKSPIELVCADNIVRKTNGNVLLLTPLAVSAQMLREAEKFGIEAKRTRNGEVHKGINITNYERLDKYDPSDFEGCIADEGSIIKNFEGATRRLVTDFMNKVKYRMIATATPSPNDFMELGCSAEALGVMARNSMLGMFFTNDGDTTQQWRLKGHAKKRFWQWLASWARAIRMPSDLGFRDNEFILPKLDTQYIKVPSKAVGVLSPVQISSLSELRSECRKTLEVRCNKVAYCVPKDRPFLAWCHLNAEGDLLKRLIPGSVQVKGSDSDDFKEESFLAFTDGEIKCLITKPRIGGFGMNWQHCSDVAYFPTYSHEQYYQAVRRCWRFGQRRLVTSYLIYSEAMQIVVDAMLRKERQAIELYGGICREMHASIEDRKEEFAGNGRIQLPKWMDKCKSK